MVEALVGAGILLFGIYIGQRMGKGESPLPSLRSIPVIGSYRAAKIREKE